MQVDDDGSTVIPVDAILFTSAAGDGDARGSGSDDDDQPIAARLLGLPKTVSLEVPAKKKRKMPKKKLYFYEVVAEPTGIASKYWDAPAPSERATKVLANERLTELQTVEDEVEIEPSPIQPQCTNTEVEIEPPLMQPQRSNIVDVTAAVALSNPPPTVHSAKKTRRTQVAGAHSRNKTFMASQSPSWHARTAQERRADLQSFMASQRQLDKAVSKAQATKAPITTITSVQDKSVENARPAREPFSCTIPPAEKKAVGTHCK
jgi:hypothetical protein